MNRDGERIWHAKEPQAYLAMLQAQVETSSSIAQVHADQMQNLQSLDAGVTNALSNVQSVDQAMTNSDSSIGQEVQSVDASQQQGQRTSTKKSRTLPLRR